MHIDINTTNDALVLATVVSLPGAKLAFTFVLCDYIQIKTDANTLAQIKMWANLKEKKILIQLFSEVLFLF